MKFSPLEGGEFEWLDNTGKVFGGDWNITMMPGKPDNIGGKCSRFETVGVEDEAFFPIKDTNGM